MLRVVALVAAFAYVFFLTLHLPDRRASWLGESWAFGLSEASLHHLAFGREIDWTYGPLGYLSAGAMLPENAQMMCAVRIAFAAFLAAAWCVQFFLPGTKARKALFAAIFLYALTLCREGATYDIALLVALVPALLVLNATPREKLPAASLVAGAFSGTLGLVKFVAALTLAGSFGIFLIVAALVRIHKRLAVRREILAITAFVAGLIVSMGAFLGNPRDLLGYIVASFEITRGYSGAMSLSGPIVDTSIAIALMTLLLAILYAERRALRPEFCAAILLWVFVIFKEGFVRQDLHEAVFFILMPLAFGVVLRAGAEPRALPAGALCIVVSFLAIAFPNRLGYSSAPIEKRFLPGAVSTALAELRSVLSEPVLQPATDPHLAAFRLPRDVLERIGSVPVDVIPLDTGVAFANGLGWAPEPVFQSYAAYTPLLDELNARSLALRADGVVLDAYGTPAAGSIDQRYPAADEPAAFSVLLCKYRPLPGIPDGLTQTADGTRFVVLRKGGVTCGQPRALALATVRWDQAYNVPSRGRGLTFLRVKIHYTAFGAVMRTLFRAPAVWMTVLGLTQSARYRIVPEVAADGILADPMPSDARDLARLMQGNLERRPLSLTFSSDDPRFFAPRIELERYEISRALR